MSFRNSVITEIYEKILLSTFIHEPILIKIYMNANIVKTRIFIL